jgi:hypothetical protein
LDAVDEATEATDTGLWISLSDSFFLTDVEEPPVTVFLVVDAFHATFFLVLGVDGILDSICALRVEVEEFHGTRGRVEVEFDSFTGMDDRL